MLRRELVAVALAIAGSGITGLSSQQVDRRTFEVVEGGTPGTYSVNVQLADDLSGAADRSRRIRVYQLADALYLRVLPQGHVKVERGAFAYAFQLSRNPSGTAVIPATDQPAHGTSSDNVRAADFRNSDNSGPNAIGPKNVNAAGELRTIAYAGYVMEIRVLSFDIVGLGPSQVAAFSTFSCVVTLRAKPQG